MSEEPVAMTDETESQSFDWEKQADREGAAREALQRRLFEALFPSRDEGLQGHARRELTKAGLFLEESDYGGMAGEAVMDLVKVFSDQGHSGFSAGLVVDLFRRVASFQVLTPLTSDPGEWNEVGPDVWQSRRQSSCFSYDGGKTWRDIDAAPVTGEQGT